MPITQEFHPNFDSVYSFDALYTREHAIRQRFPELCEINPKYGNIAGVFGGGHHSEMEQGLLYLNPFEQYVIHVIQSLVHKVDRPILVLDEGGMVGESMVVIGFTLRDLVHAGKVELYISNYEKNYSLAALIAEGERRFNFATLYEEIKARKEQDVNYKDVLGTMQNRTMPIVKTQAEIDFIRKWSYLVEYQEGIDVLKLANSYQPVIANGGFHIIHDYFAGLAWSENPKLAHKSVISCTDIDRGAVMSNVLWHDYPYPKSIVRAELSGEEIGIKSPYVILSRPQSPARVLRLSDEMPFFKL